MAKHRIEIVLNDDEEKFLKWLAKYDTSNRDHKVTVNEELRWMLELELRETMELYSQGDVKEWED